MLQTLGRHVVVVLVLLSARSVLAQEVPDVVWEVRGDAVSTLAFAPGGQLVAVGSSAGTVALRRVSDGRVVRTITPANGGQIRALAFSPDGQLLAVGTSTTYFHLTVWRVADGSLRSGPLTGGGSALAFSPDGRLLAAGTKHQSVVLWRVSDMQVLRSFSFTGYGNIVHRVAFAPGGQQLATSGSNLYVRLWQVSSGALQRKLSQGGIGVPKRGLVFLPGGQTLAAGSDDGSLRLWRVSDGAPLRAMTADSAVLALAVNGRGDTLVSAGESIAFWSLPDGARLLSYDDVEASALALSPDDQLLCYGSADGTVVMAENPLP